MSDPKPERPNLDGLFDAFLGEHRVTCDRGPTCGVYEAVAEAKREFDRLRAIEKAAMAVAKNWTVEDCPPNMRMRLVWRFEHESLRAALREKGAEK